MDATGSSGSAVTKVPADDEDAVRKAIMEVVQVWLDRLQLISVIVSPSTTLQYSYTRSQLQHHTDDFFLLH